MEKISIKDWVSTILLGDMQVICKWILGGIKQTFPNKRIGANQISNDDIQYIRDTYSTSLILLYELFTTYTHAKH